MGDRDVQKVVEEIVRKKTLEKGSCSRSEIERIVDNIDGVSFKSDNHLSGIIIHDSLIKYETDDSSRDREGGKTRIKSIWFNKNEEDITEQIVDLDSFFPNQKNLSEYPTEAISGLLEQYRLFRNTNWSNSESWKYRFFNEGLDSEYDLENLNGEDIGEIVTAFSERRSGVVVPAYMIGGRAGSEVWNAFKQRVEEKPDKVARDLSHLFDLSDSLDARLNRFEDKFSYILDETRASGGSLLGLATFLLMAAYPDKYIFYKQSLFSDFFEEFNGPDFNQRAGFDVEQYENVLSYSKQLKRDLSKKIENTSMVDVQDTFYFYKNYWLPEGLKSELDSIKNNGGSAYTRLFALKCFFEEQEDGSISEEDFDKVVKEKAEKEDLPGENKSSYIQLNYNVFRNYEPFTASDDEYGVKEEYHEYLNAMSHYVDYLWSEVTSERSYYLISHNEHPEGLDEGFLKAPYTESSEEYSGRYQPSHDLSRLEVGDKLLHYRSGEFKGYSKVEEEPEVRTNDEGEKEFYVEVDIQKFDEPRRLGSVRRVLEEEKEKVDRYYALDEKGGKAEGYLKVLTERGFKHVVNMEDPQPGVELDEKLSADLDLELDDLYFPEDEEESIKSQIKASLNSGKHIIFTGPPGTGKTELAEKVADEMESKDDNVTGYQLTTATSDWSTFDTVGGYRPEDDGSLEFKPGHILRRFKDDEKDLKNEALVIDEINRADIDKAFGQLFTVLSGQKVQLPFTKGETEKEVEVIPGGEFEKPVEDHEFVVPESWRILATMNTYDKTSLYEMSYAFMRRFSFIRIEAPDLEGDYTELVKGYLDAWNLEDLYSEEENEIDLDELVEDVAEIWKSVNNAVEGREIGPAIAKDMIEFSNANDRSHKDANTAAITNFIFPQLEGVPDRKKIVESLLDEDLVVDENRLKSTAGSMLQVEFDGED